MKRFTQLFTELDQTTKTTKKVEAMVRYFGEADDEDKIWAIALLGERRPRRSVRSNLIRDWAAEAAGIPAWLFDESRAIVGDMSETISMIVPRTAVADDKPLHHWMEFIASLADDDEAVQKQKVLNAWAQMDQMERFLFNKLIGGSFRVGLSVKLMTKALSRFTGLEESQLAHRLMGNWSPNDTTFQKLIVEEDGQGDVSKPYPFCLAYALEKEVAELGDPIDWFAERKWDGIRGQLIVRNNELFVWSRGEDLVTDKFPEYKPLTKLLPNGTVIDGEILAFKDGRPMPFNALQTRIGRKNITKKVLDDAPVVLVAYDLLEYGGEDIRKRPLQERRQMLEDLIKHTSQHTSVLQLSDFVAFHTWEELSRERECSRENYCEGLMLKNKHSVYKVGRRKGDWWKWKIDPLMIDAVLIYAMQGSGRRANLYTDYTFAVWNGDQLVPFTKAYSGLTDEEIKEVDRFVKKNTLERFGPVRSVVPQLVFEIAFEGIQRSTRHKSGVALRFPRMNRWRKDKPAQEANTLADLQQLLLVYEQTFKE
ncbi:MAG: ATP-dependent DNA ligase [Chitinophagales bacterium]|nr:ATP-dependent DNA ligase [Chitinophagales bacterium]